MNWKNSTLLGVLGVAVFTTDAAAATCDALRSFSIKQATIASAEIVHAGPWVQPARGGTPGQPGAAAQPAGRAQAAAAAQPAAPPPAPVMLPEHCRVKMVLKPSSDSNINAELWLPITNWNGKFMAV